MFHDAKSYVTADSISSALPLLYKSVSFPAQIKKPSFHSNYDKLSYKTDLLIRSGVRQIAGKRSPFADLLTDFTSDKPDWAPGGSKGEIGKKRRKYITILPAGR